MTTGNHFKYLGLTFIPCRNKTKEEEGMGLHLPFSDLDDSPEGWNYEEFYKTAKNELGEQGGGDIYLVDCEERLPMLNFLAYLSPLKDFSFTKVTRELVITEENYIVRHVNRIEAGKYAIAYYKGENRNDGNQLISVSNANVYNDEKKKKIQLFHLHENNKHSILKESSSSVIKDTIQNLLDNNVCILDAELFHYGISFGDNIFWFCAPDPEMLADNAEAQEILKEYEGEASALLKKLTGCQKTRDILLSGHLWHSMLIDSDELSFARKYDALGDMGFEPSFDEDIPREESNMIICYACFLQNRDD